MSKTYRQTDKQSEIGSEGGQTDKQKERENNMERYKMNLEV